MYCKLIYNNKTNKIKNIFRLYLINVIFDLVKCALINVPQLILITTLFSVLFHEIPNAKKGLRILIVSLLIAQLVFILLNQFRKREPYVFISSAGILLHIRSFENYGIGIFPKQDMLIPYSKIKDCYISVPYTMERNMGIAYKNMWMDTSDFFKGKIGFRHKTEVPYIFPSIADGRYDQKCVLVRLFNNYTIVLPIDHCEQFLQNFKKYSSCSSGE